MSNFYLVSPMNCSGTRDGCRQPFRQMPAPKTSRANLSGSSFKLLHTLWLTLIIALCLHTGAIAQQVQANSGAPAIFYVANQPETVTVTILPGATAGGSLAITLPAGYQYISGSATATGPGGFSVSEASTSAGGATITLSGISSGQNSTFTYKARALCGVVEEEGGDGLASYVLTLTGGSAQPARSSNPFNAEYAKFNLALTTNGSYTGLVGDTYSRTYTITNGGFGSIDTVYIDSRNGNGLTLNSLSPSSGTAVLISTTPAGNDVISRYRIVGIGDGHFDQGETITITENLTLASCNNLASNIEAWYGPNGNKCTAGDANGSTTGGAGIDNSKQPVMVLTPMTQFKNCFGKVSVEQFKLTNTGTAAMKNVLVNLWAAQLAAPFQPNADGIRGGYGNITYTINGGSPVTATIVETQDYNSPHPSMAGYPGRKLFSIPEIKPGDEVVISYETKSIDYGTVCFQRAVAGDMTTWSFENPCGIVTNSPGITALKGSIYASSLSIISDTPSDMYEGQTYSMSLDMTGAYMPQVFQNGGALVYTIGLPANVVFSGSISDFIANHPDYGSPGTPSSFDYNAAAHTLTVIYEFPGTPSTLYRHNGLHIQLNNLTVDCTPPLQSNPQFTVSVSVRQGGSCSGEGVHPLRCESHATLIHCGTCERGGFIPLAGQVQRINYGLPDNNNDGKPDAGGTLDMTKVETNRVIHGDTVMMRYSGRILTNVSTPTFTQGYADITFAGADNNWLQGIIPLGARVEVWQGGTMVGAQDNLPVSTLSVSTRRLDFSISQLTSFPSSYTSFSNNDSLVVTLRYRYVQYGSTNGISADNSITSINNIYVSNVANPTTEADKWYCDLLGGNVNWAGLNMTHNITTSAAHTGCSDVTITNDNHLGVGLQGYASSERFPYEYRPISFFDTVRVNVPENYEFVSFKAVEAISSGYYDYINREVFLQPLDVNARPLVFVLTQQYDINGGPWHLADEGHNIAYSLVLRPTCETEAGNKPFQFFKGQRETAHLNNVFPWTAHNVLPGTIGNLSYSKPNIVLTTSNAEVTVASAGVSWEVQVANTTTYAASNVWLAEDAGDNGITITSVEILSGPNGTVTGTVSAVNGVYHLGDFTTVGSKYYRINADYTRCGRDEMILAYGYNCSAYPNNVQGTTCKLAQPLAVIPQNAAVQVTIISQPSASVKHDLCAVLPYEVQILNPSLADITEVGLRIKLPAMGGLELVSGSLEVNTGTGWQSITGTSGGGYINTPIPAGILADLGGSETVNLRFNLRTTGCDFVSGSTLTFQALGKSPCNTAIIGTPQRTNKINIEGSADNTNSYTITSSVTDADACEPNALTYTFAALNDGPLATYAGEKLFVTIPAPYTLGTITAGTNWSGFSAPVASAATSGTTYTWEIPAGIASGQTMSFTAQLTAPAANVTALSCDSLQISELIAYSFEAVCITNNATCSGVLQSEGENESTKIPVVRPTYQITGFTASANGTNVTGTITINRTNNVAKTNASTISVYYDVNGDGVLDSTDPLLGTDDVTIADTPNPQTLNYEITTGNRNEEICNLIVVVEPDCSCEKTIKQAVALTECFPLPVKLAGFEVRASTEGSVNLSWVTTSETSSSHFNVEQSIDSKQWKSIGRVQAAGNTVTGKTYHFTDVAPVQGINYYRLKMTDLDGSFEHSPIRSAVVASVAAKLYPNPVTDVLIVNPAGTREISKVELLDVSGKAVHSSGAVSRIDVARLSAGIYILRISYADGGSDVERVIKK